MPDSPELVPITPRPASSRAGSSGAGWTPPSVEHLQALLPQYEILSMLGHGGMGAVYKGKQKSLDRMVAIKILPPGLDDEDAKFTERFKNEARTMAKLMHPGIVAVFDFGEIGSGDTPVADGGAGSSGGKSAAAPSLYFVMEYVDGTDVAKMITTSGHLPPDHALAVTAHVCDALAYAHANGVIHRDIKPANILINMQGQVKVADFGLAKADDPSQTSGLTKTGLTMGTPDFVAPEALIMGVNVDGRADLYAIGVMLYQMLTGEIPRGLFLMPGIKTNGAIDPRFDRIITRAMQTDREMRYQTATEIRKDLDVILTTPRIKQDASKAAAAVPEQAVKNVPGQRSAAAKPVMRGPGQPAAKSKPPPEKAAPDPKSQIPDLKSKKKSPLPAILGIAAVLAIGAGLFFMFSGNKNGDTPAAGSGNTNGGKSAAAPAQPVKIVEPSPSAPPAGSVATPATSDGWIDGLAEWVAAPGNVQGGIMKEENGAWRIVKGESVRFGPQTPGSFLANVAVRVTIRDMGDKNFAINVRGQGSGKGAYQARFRSSGQSDIFLELPEKKQTALGSFQVPAGFVAGPRHVMEFRAEGDLLTIILDGQMAGSAKDTTFASGTISISGVGLLIEKIEYRDLGGTPAVAAASRPSATSDGWIDGLAEWLAVPGNATKGVLVQEGNAWRYKGPSAIDLGAKLTPPRVAANVAVRYSVRFGRKQSPISIKLRTQKAAGCFYQVTVYGGGAAGISVTKDGQSTELVKCPIPGGLDETAAHLIEFRAEGDKLTLLVNGVERGSVNDSTYASGGFSVANELIEKIEYRDLGGTAAVTAASKPSTTSDGWTDGLAEWLAVPGNATKKTLQKEGDGWRYRGPESIKLGAKLSPPYQLANVAVRLTSKGGGGSTFLRDQGGAGNHYLALQAYPGFEIRRGQNSKYTTLAKFKPPAGFNGDTGYVMEFRAEGEVLTLMVDGQTLGSVKDSTYTSGMFTVSPLNALIQKLEYRDLGSTPTTPAVSTAEAGWIDGLAEWLAAPENAAKTTLVKEGNAWRYKGPEAIGLGAKLTPPRVGANVAVRFTTRNPGQSASNIKLRGQKAGGNYQAILWGRGVAEIKLTNGQQVTDLAKYEAPPGFDENASHTYEFRAQGDVLTLIVDGETRGSVKDSTFSSGGISVQYGLIEKLEYRDLGSAPAAPSRP